METANGNVKPTDIRKIFNLQIFGRLDFRNILILLYVINSISKKTSVLLKKNLRLWVADLSWREKKTVW